MNTRRNRLLAGIIIAMTLTLMIPSPSPAHETDQFTLPLGREFADLKDYFTQWVYDTIDRAVNKTNEKIRQCVNSGRNARRLAELQSADEIVHAVNSEFPAAYNVIEGMESEVRSAKMAKRYPGMLIGYKEAFTNVEQHVHFPLDPRQIFRIWLASTFKCDGVYLGSDKIGHFTDMGMNYYRPYSAALKKGKTKAQAIADAVDVGTHGLLFSERGMVGFLSAGDYSNGDLAANYLGFKFYVNLTETTMLDGKPRPPMLVIEGDYWKFAPFVRRDSDFFTAFMCDHLNEALNPGLFEEGMRDPLRTAVRERAERILCRYLDTNGNRRTRAWFDKKVEELATYFGEDYGHDGKGAELVTIGNTCFASFAFKGDVKIRDQFGNTALHDAAIRCDLEAIKQLLDHGADVNAPVRSSETYSPDWGSTPLHFAARDGHRAAIELLLSRGADVNARNDRGATPLHRAVTSAAIVDFLLKNGANLGAKDNLGRTALHWAASEGLRDSAEVLINAGANVNLKDSHGETPLMRAARWQRDDVAELLLAHGAAVDSPGNFATTPLHLAAATEDSTLVKLLLDMGANASAQDEFGWSPLHVAARDGSEAVAAMLLDRGANASLRDTAGITPLHVAARKGRSDVALMLLAKGADVNARSDVGVTPLHEAAFVGDKSIVAILLKQKADAGVRNRMGLTPLDLAVSANNRDAAAALRTGTPPAITITR